MQPIPILFENAGLIVVNKPVGIAMHDAVDEIGANVNTEIKFEPSSGKFEIESMDKHQESEFKHRKGKIFD